MNTGFTSKNDEKMTKEHIALLRAQINNSPYLTWRNVQSS